MMKKIFVVLGILFSAILVSGCEKKQQAQNLSATPSANQFHIWTASHKDFLDATAREFLPKAGLTSVQPIVTLFESESEMQSFLIEKMAEGIAPDVVFTNADWIFINRKKLIALKGDPLFTTAAFDSAYVKAATEPLLTEDALLGIPLSVETLAMIYNREILIDGLDDRNVPGKTWNEIKSDAEKLTQSDNSFSRLGRSGIALGDLKSIKYGTDILKNILVQNDLKFFADDQKSATFGRQLFLTESGERSGVTEEVFEFFASFADTRFKQFSWSEQLITNDIDKDFGTFVKGKTAIVFGYPSDVSYLKDLIARTSGSISSNDIATALFPQQTNQDKELLAKVTAFAVPKTARNPEVSWNFLKYVSKKEIHQKFFETTQTPSARLDLIAEHANTPLYDTFVRQTKFARTLIFPKPVPSKDFDGDLIQIFESVKFGGTKLQKNIKKYEDLLTKVLIDYWAKDELINKLVPAPEPVVKK